MAELRTVIRGLLLAKPLVYDFVHTISVARGAVSN
jgi:hypothetical protein